MPRVVVVEDSGLECRVVGEALAAAMPEVEVSCALAAQTALAELVKGTVDALVVGLPGFDFRTVSLLSWARELSPATRLVVIGPDRFRDVAQSVQQLRVDAYLPRPVRPERLVEALAGLGSSREGAPTAGASAPAAPVRDLAATLELISTELHGLHYRACVEAMDAYLRQAFEEDDACRVESLALELAEGLLDILPAGTVDDRDAYLRRLRFRVNREFGEYETFVELERLIGRAFDRLEAAHPYEPGDFRAVVNYIDRRVTKDLNLTEVSAVANMSTSYFSRFFKREMGVSFIGYVTDEKIERAKRMLVDSDCSVIRIASDLAYARASYFSKTFKKKVGISPTEYRERNSRRAVARRAV